MRIDSSQIHRPGRAQTVSGGFTLIELGVVIATVAMLLALLVPALAGAKGDILMAQCQSNLKQLGSGFSLFEQDHNEMFPAAGVAGDDGSQMAWDTYIHRYIGGTSPDQYLSNGWIPAPISLKVEYCPADAPGKLRKASWMGNPPWNGLRSFAMISCGTDLGVNWQVDTKYGTYPLPSIAIGVGIYWVRAPKVDWEAKSYKSSVVKDPAGTVLLVEEPNTFDSVGNIWPCASFGPLAPPGAAYPVFYQLDPTHPAADTGILICNEGWPVYVAQLNTFNYLFHDNHVEALPIEQTVGSGTTNSPQGIWTVAPGD